VFLVFIFECSCSFCFFDVLWYTVPGVNCSVYSGLFLKSSVLCIGMENISLLADLPSLSDLCSSYSRVIAFGSLPVSPFCMYTASWIFLFFFKR
jgi:hypothetical protein